MDPLRRRLREPDPVVPLAGAPAGFQAPNGSAPIRCCRLSRRSGIHLGAQGARDNAVFSDGPAPAPEERLVPVSSRGHPTAHANDRVESSSGVARRIASPASPRVSSKTPRPGRQLPRAGTPAGGRRGSMRRKGTCEPNLSKSTRASRRRPRPGAPGTRGRRASRRSARFSRSFRGRCRRFRPVPSEAAASGVPGAHATTGLATDVMRETPCSLRPGHA